MGGNYSKDIFKQLEEVILKCDSLSAEIKDIKAKHKIDLKNQEIRLKQEFAKERHKYNKQISELNSKINRLEKENEQLRNDNKRMKSILNNNSSNSSIPPSKDQKRNKPNQYNSRKKSGKSCGGQKDHKGSTLTEEKVVQKIESGLFEHKIVTIGTQKGRYISRYEVDLEIKPVVTEYRFYEDAEGKISIPPEYKSSVVYGPQIRTIAVHLYGEGAMSFERIQCFLNAISKELNVSTGSIYNFIREFDSKSELCRKKIAEELLNADVIYTDATIIRSNGKNTYIRNFSTKDAVLYTAMEKKNLENLHSCEVLEQYTGTLVHDHETSLYHFGTEHGECNVHLERYLRKNSEESGNSWSIEMKELFSEMHSVWKCKQNSQTIITDDEISEYSNKYDILIKKGDAENQKTKNKYTQKSERALLNRMEKYKENHLLFLKNPQVDYSNNMSERDLRKSKTKQKVSGCFRKQSGSRMYCSIITIIETCKRKKLEIMRTIENIFTKEPVSI